MFAIPVLAASLSFGAAPPTTGTTPTSPIATAVRSDLPPPLFVVGPSGPPPGGTPAVPTVPIPGGSTTIKMQAACPGEVAQPFQRQPRVTVLPPCQSDGGVAAPTASWTVEFDEAAHFPLPRFDQDRKAVPDTDGLIIYEGMRLTVDATNGTYDLAFTASVPGCLTVLRLQIEFSPCQPELSGKKYKLTLPPIRLEPSTESRRGNTDADTFHVHHRGYSSIFLSLPGLNANCPQLSQRQQAIHGNNGWTVRRTGTARFGTPVAVDETGR